MKKPNKGKWFALEKYGMIFCPICAGSGKSVYDAKEGRVCKVCGGFGLIKKEENDFHGKRVKVQLFK
jgi:rRNA maturation endonuclease Nob1